MIYTGWSEKEKNMLITAYTNKTPIWTIKELEAKDDRSLARMAVALGLNKKYPDFDYMVGRKFGLLTVVKKISDKQNKKTKYECECSCENLNHVIVSGDNLKSGNTKSCGCLYKKDLTGHKFGRLTVIGLDTDFDYSKVKDKHNRRWICSCQCGNIKTVSTGNLRSGGVKSCGCLLGENFRNPVRNEYRLDGDYGIGFDTNGREFYFDLEDYDKIKDRYWFVDSDRKGYVISKEHLSDKQRTIFMHRVIMSDYLKDNNLQVDHIHTERKNDNRKSNLRLATQSQNSMNRKIASNNTSGVPGVYYRQDTNCWRAVITKDYIVYHLGDFNKFEDAVKARKAAEEVYFKDRSYNNSQAIDIDK